MRKARARWQALAALFLLLSSCLISCQARTPGKLETAFAQTIKRDLTVGGKNDLNPFPPSQENIEAGRRNFANYCMVCHGLDAQNTGVPFADRMSPPVPSLNSTAVQQYSDGQIKRIIDDGIFPSGMPASKGILHDDEIWQIVVYLRHLPPKGSLGDPAVYGGPSGSSDRISAREQPQSAARPAEQPGQRNRETRP